MKKIKHIHFVGIKGVGMAPLAIIAKEAGFKVTGSDITEEFITDISLKRAGIKPLEGFLAERIKGADLVITTGAHGGFNNEETKTAKEKGIPVMTQGEAAGAFMEGSIFNKKFQGISVAGCHGKTTTTAMIATILKESGLDPSFLIGTGEVASLGSCGHFGKGKYFIAEADEYATEPVFDKTAKLLWQHPKIAVFTNIGFDHPDLYKSIDEIRNTFLQFARQLPEDGVLIVNGDDKELVKLIDEYKGRIITFGFSPQNDYMIKRVSISDETTFFRLDSRGVDLGEFMLNVIGSHNVLNGVGALIAAYECGLDYTRIKSSLAKFKGSKRRLEYIGRLSTGALLFDDYAHHPTEIKKTLEAFRQAYPKSKLVCIFQPHTYSRTKSLFDEFIYSLMGADLVILVNIYPSLREKPDPTISSETLTNKLASFNTNVLFLPRLSDVVEYIEQKDYGRDTIIITMGAGDVYKIANHLDFLH